MKRLAILSGAGVSKESGINTFRDSNGLWEQYPVEEVASIEGWYKNPQLMLRFYNMRRKDLQSREPNKAHKIIAELEKHFKIDVITQNVDNLHERAGSTNIIHLHGELTKARGEHSEYPVYDIGYEDINWGDKTPSGEQLRPHIVWFGEAVPKIDQAIDAVEAADILLIVGTSLQVYPAAGLYRYAKTDIPIYIIDPKDVPLRDSRVRHIKDVATSGMETLLSLLSSERRDGSKQ